MSKGIYLFGLDYFYSEEEKELSDELYDKYSHNEITGKEIIDKIADYCGFDMDNLEQYSSYEIEEIEKPLYENSNFVLTYDQYTGNYDIYMRVFTNN